MLVVNANEVKPDDRPEISMKTLFSENAIENGITTFGTVSIPPKTRLPLSGTGAHEQDEYSMILKGSVAIYIGDQEYRMSAGNATLIPAGEAHWCINDGDEDCEIVWVLVKK
jgi:quercetin dioxygenase-like cupin family protein